MAIESLKVGLGCADGNQSSAKAACAEDAPLHRASKSIRKIVAEANEPQGLEIRKSSKAGKSFNDIPDENIQHIVRFMDGKSICKVEQSCSLLRKVARNDGYWHALCRSEWGISSDYLKCHKDISSKVLYASALGAIRRLTRKVLEEQCFASMRYQISNRREEERQRTDGCLT